MIEQAYLTATRGDFTTIEDKENRFQHLVQALRDLLQGFDTKCLFIRSQKAKYQLLTLGQEAYCICDRQIDFYFNAIDAGRNRRAEGHDTALLDAAMLVACCELFYAGQSRMANEFFDHYCKKHAFTLPGHDFFREVGRQHFTIFHEIGHVQMGRQPEADQHFRSLSNAKFVDLFGVLSGFDRRVRLYKERVEHECAADIFAMLAGVQYIKENEAIVGVGLGGISGFLFSALQTVMYQWGVSKIRTAVEMALANTAEDEESEDLDLVRIRIIRQAANDIAIAELGEERARAFHEEFQAFLTEMYRLFSSEAPAFVAQVIRTNRENLVTQNREREAEEFLAKTNWY